MNTQRLNMPKPRKFQRNKRNSQSSSSSPPYPSNESQQSPTPTQEQTNALIGQQIHLLQSDCRNIQAHVQVESHSTRSLSRLASRINQSMRGIEDLFKRQVLTEGQLNDLIQSREAFEKLGFDVAKIKATGGKNVSETHSN